MTADTGLSPERRCRWLKYIARAIYATIIIVLGARVLDELLPLVRPPKVPPPLLLRSSAIIQSLTAALESYRSAHGAYPPDRAAGIHPDLDQSAECLVYYLSGGSIYYNPERSRPRYPWRHEVFDLTRGGKNRDRQAAFFEFTRYMLCDTDGDGIPEVLDEWGRPLRYNTGGQDDGPFNQNGAPTRHPGRFDLASAGPDGRFDTDDDIGNW